MLYKYHALSCCSLHKSGCTVAPRTVAPPPIPSRATPLRGLLYAPKWDEPSPNDAVVPLPPAVKAAAAKAAAQERSQRAEVRARPDWWGPRREGSAMNTMKLRPAFTASSPEGEEPETGDRGVEETKGGDPEPRGATGGTVAIACTCARGLRQRRLSRP